MLPHSDSKYLAYTRITINLPLTYTLKHTFSHADVYVYIDIK